MYTHLPHIMHHAGHDARGRALPPISTRKREQISGGQLEHRAKQPHAADCVKRDLI